MPQLAYPISDIAVGGWHGLGRYLLDGTGDHLVSKDSGRVDLTADLALIWCGSLDDWTPVATQNLIAKWNTSNFSYRMFVTTTPRLALSHSTNGTTETQDTSAVLPAWADGSIVWVMATLVADDGGGNYVKDYWYSLDPPDTPVADVAWTNLGGGDTVAGVTSVFSGTADVWIGEAESGGGPLSGKTHGVWIMSGVGLFVTDAWTDPDIFTERFTGTNGDPWNTLEWTDDDINGAVTDIQGNAGNMQIPASIGTGAIGRARATNTTHTAVDIKFSHRFGQVGTDGKQLRFHWRGSNDWAFDHRPTSGYFVNRRLDSGNIEIYRNDGGSGITQLGTTYSPGVADTVTLWFRIQHIGSALKLKVWQDGNPEPTTWTREVTDGTYTSGIIQTTLAYFAGSDLLCDSIIDDLEVQTGGLGWDGVIWNTSQISGTPDFEDLFGKGRVVVASTERGGAYTDESFEYAVEILVRATYPLPAGGSANMAVGVGDNAFTGDHATNGYWVTATGTGTDFELWESTAGSAAQLGSGFGTTTGDDWIRFRREGSNLKVKTWAVGSREPTSWGIETTDATFAGPFYPYLMAANDAGVYDFDEFAANPVPRAEADFRTPQPVEYIAPAADGDYAGAVDQASFDTTNDLDVRCLAYVNEVKNDIDLFVARWAGSPANDDFTFGREDFTGGPNNGTGLVVRWRRSGGGTLDTLFSDGDAIKEGGWRWYRVVVDVSVANGTFYISDDPPTTDPSEVTWTQHGSVINLGAVSSRNSTVNQTMRIGGSPHAPGETIDGRIAWAEVRDGIDGPPIISPDWRDLDVGYVYLGGNDDIQTVDKAQLDITGDMEVIMLLEYDSYTPAVNSFPLGKYVAAGDQRSWRTQIASTGVWSFTWSEDGIATLAENADTNLTALVADGEHIWLRITWDVDNGASNYDGYFYYSLDPITTPVDQVVWTQIGTVEQGAGTTSFFNSTAEMKIGQTTVGKVYGAWVYNGIGGTLVFGVDYRNGFLDNDSLGNALTYSNVDAYHGPITGFLHCDGAGDFISTTSDYSLGTNVVEMLGCFALDDWTPAAKNGLITNTDAIGNRGCFLAIDSTGPTGSFEYNWFDGTVQQTVNSSVAVPGVDGDHLWVRVVHDLDVGGTDSTVTFYTSDDPVHTDPADVTWTQLGTVYNHGSTTSITAAADQIAAGRGSGGSAYLAGEIFVAQAKDNGVVVATFDARTKVPDYTDEGEVAVWSGDLVWQIEDTQGNQFGLAGGDRYYGEWGGLYQSWDPIADATWDDALLFPMIDEPTTASDIDYISAVA